LFLHYPVKLVPGPRFKGVKQKLYRFHPDVSCSHSLSLLQESTVRAENNSPCFVASLWHDGSAVAFHR
jgi:hypothetical protein